ncbi:hypothetical protein QBC34DRAFT_416944 [Podospora aff. communis PSN243]|uniref:Regulatory P domain-containing protein n=1 Tax=Podospora aff. communis PSN243 TaxID=3040156 RepID=A0AAV9G826_9PEZI|nr:hypothetical protein QBC34DRAFT_416944 [Podospora aff. communis PSN243]
MKGLTVAAVVLTGLLPVVCAKELQPDEGVSALYDTGAVHEQLMAKKMSTWSRQRKGGAFNSRKWKSRPGANNIVYCNNGTAKVIPGDPLNTFRCNNVDFYDFVSHADLGSQTGEGSSSWGWTSPNGREFVAIAQADGAAFAEINHQGRLVYLGRLPQSPEAEPSIWREIRGYKSYIVIGSEATNHGVQIFDMSKLLTVNPKKPVTFNPKTDLTGFWNGLPVGRTHNVVVNEEKEYGVAVGAAPRSDACRAGLIFFDLKDPSKPTSLGCAADDGYVHDAQCLVYRGPDTKYAGRDICYGYNEDTLTIYDVTDKNTTKLISRTTYTGASYTHQGWVTNTEWQEFLLLDDELDESFSVGPAASGFPVTYIWDIRSLEAPKQTGFYRSSAYGIDHNQFVINGLAYQSNYGAGLRILDVRSIKDDPTGAGVKELGYFDIYPEDDGEPNGGVVDFVGTWSHYPFFKSGYILVNTIERGAFVVKLRK